MNRIPEKRLKNFFESAFERHKIYVLKTLGVEKPWTEDKIFQNWFFCNVFRRIDKTTVWIEENIIKPQEESPDLWKNIILYRYISNINTFEKFKATGIMYDRKNIYGKMRSMQKENESIFTSAFIVNSGIGDGKWVDKVTYIFKLLANLNENNIDARLKGTNSLKEIYKFFKLFPGVGSFMAYEYVTDFSYSKRYLAKSPDIYTWCDLGLGAVRGINVLIKGFASRKKVYDKYNIIKYIFGEWIKYIRNNLQWEIKNTIRLYQSRIHQELSQNTIGKINQLYSPFKKLTMREVEHWLCEYDKYCRGGSKKRSYDGI